MSQRLSRKEIKRDEFMESVGGAFEYVQNHAGQLIIAAVVVVVGLVIAGLVFNHSQRQERRAGEALSAALKVMEAEIDPVAADPDNEAQPTFANEAARSARAKNLLMALSDDFGGTDAAAIATAYLGQIAAEEGDMSAARSHWEAYLDESGGNSLAVEVALNLMALDRAEGRGDELVTSLRARLSSNEDELPPDLLWYELALTLDSLGREVEADEAYQRLLEDYPHSAFASDARQRTGSSVPPLFGS